MPGHGRAGRVDCGGEPARPTAMGLDPYRETALRLGHPPEPRAGRAVQHVLVLELSETYHFVERIGYEQAGVQARYPGRQWAGRDWRGPCCQVSDTGEHPNRSHGRKQTEVPPGGLRRGVPPTGSVGVELLGPCPPPPAPAQSPR